MEMEGWGEGTYPVMWTQAPEYPNNLPNIG